MIPRLASASARAPEVGEEVEAPLGARHVDPRVPQSPRARPPEGAQDPPDVPEVPLEAQSPLERAHRGVLDRRRSRRVRLARDGRHRLEQPTHRGREHERPEAPTARPAPLGQAAADDRPLGVEARDRDVLSLVMQFAVDLVGEQHDAVLARDAGDFPQVDFLVGRTRRVARVVEDEDARSLRIFAAQRRDRVRRDSVPVLRGGRQPTHLPADDTGLRRVGHPGGGGDDEVAVVDELEKEHQLLAARSDQHVVGGHSDALSAAMVVGDRRAQGRQAPDRQVSLLVGVGLQLFDDRARDGERRLPETQLVDVPALRDEAVARLVDGDRRGVAEPADVQVDVDFGGRCRVLPLRPFAFTRSPFHDEFTPTPRGRNSSRFACARGAGPTRGRAGRASSRPRPP